MVSLSCFFVRAFSRASLIVKNKYTKLQFENKGKKFVANSVAVSNLLHFDPHDRRHPRDARRQAWFF